jgi:hypothetical protein
MVKERKDSQMKYITLHPHSEIHSDYPDNYVHIGPRSPPFKDQHRRRMSAVTKEYIYLDHVTLSVRMMLAKSSPQSMRILAVTSVIDLLSRPGLCR